MMKDLFPEVPFIQGDTIALKALTQNDAVALQEFVDSPRVYRYLPTFLFEKKYDDVHLVIDRLYTECLEESLILGVFDKEGFGGLAEFYGYRGDQTDVEVSEGEYGYRHNNRQHYGGEHRPRKGSGKERFFTRCARREGGLGF